MKLLNCNNILIKLQTVVIDQQILNYDLMRCISGRRSYTTAIIKGHQIYQIKRGL